MPDIPFGALGELAGFVRAQLAAVADRVGGLVRGAADDAPGSPRDPESRAASVIVAAAAPFAPTAQARARLLRQLHASGLLSAVETERAGELLRRTAS